MRKAWREAAKVVERSWPRTPSAELAALYGEVAPEAKPLEQVKRFGRLAALNPEHRESHLALAEANLAAGLWGEARRHLGHLVALPGEDPPHARVRSAEPTSELPSLMCISYAAFCTQKQQHTHHTY